MATAIAASARDRLASLTSAELDRAYRLAGLLLGSAPEAEDATQDALARAWNSAPALRDPARFDAWLDRIVVNVCRDRLRRRGRIRFIALADEHGRLRSTDPFVAFLEGDDLRRAVATLEDDLRLVLVLHFWADLTLEAIAERVGWPVGTVKSRLHRGLERLRGRLDEDGGSQP